MNGNYRQNIINFIEKNGWKCKNKNEEYLSFYKKDNICIDINNEGILLVNDRDVFLHFSINNMSVYTLLGYLIQNEYLSKDYKW